MSDDARKNQEKSSAALASLATAAVLTALKLSVGFYTNSLGILSEALHSGFDLLAAGLTFFAVRMAARPADASHPYGHGKVENLAALAETALLLLTCGWIIGEAVDRLFYKAAPVLPSLWGVGVMLVSIILDVHRVRLLRAVAKKHKSQALEADALHFSSDILSSSVVMVGLLCIWGGQYLPSSSPLHPYIASLDAVAALLVSLIVLHASYVLARKSINDLMDSGSTELRESIENAVLELEGIGGVHAVRLRQSGPDAFVDLHICVSPHMSVEGGHTLAHKTEQLIKGIVPAADVVVHVEPIKEELTNPLLILQHAAATHNFAIHGLQLLETAQGLHVELHAEMPGDLSLEEAHARISAFEAAVLQDIGPATIVSHLEPEGMVQRDACIPLPCASAELTALQDTVERVLREEGRATCCHRMHAYRLGGDEGARLCLSFHCRMPAGTSVDKAHEASQHLEQALRLAIADLGRIVVHMEPQDLYHKHEGLNAKDQRQ